MPTLKTTDQFDRCSEKRADVGWQQAQLKASESRFIVLVGLKPVITSNEDRSKSDLRWFDRDEVAKLKLPVADALFLGTEAGAARFAIPVPDHIANHAPGGTELLRPAVDLRSLALQGVMSPADLSLGGQAVALSNWHLNARHCGHCGGTTLVRDGGWRRKCWACGNSVFPRTDPVVIMLITHGDQCLLGHEERFGEKLYSTLAGFVEHGEDIEHAVRREVKEEAGITVGEVRYHSSQPWPFPHSLMIGCVGKAETTDLTIDYNELQDARWFSRDETRQMMAGEHPDGLVIPGGHAIAYRLISAFVSGEE